MAKVSETNRILVKRAIDAFPEWKRIHVDEAYVIKYAGYDFGPKYYKALGAYEALEELIEEVGNDEVVDEKYLNMLKSKKTVYFKRSEAFQIALNCYVKEKVAEHNALATELHSQRMAARKRKENNS